MKNKKNKKKVRLKDQVAPQELVDKYAANIMRYGRDWHLIHPKRAKLLLKAGIEPKHMTDHLVRRADIQVDRMMREQTRKWNTDPARRHDRLIQHYNGSDCLEPGETLGYVVVKPEIKKGTVLQTLTNKWQTSTRICKVNNYPKSKVLKALKGLIKHGFAIRRKKDDGTFQYKLKEKR